jgi:large subunit ribosomal protein L4
METKIYNQKGEEAGKISLPEHVFGLSWNADLVHQVVMSILSSMRKPIAHTKNRGDVRGGGIKPWQQKGTGRARHGSIRSPLWVGGGVTHGPRNDKNYDRKVSKKMKAKALFTILSRKMKEGEILFVDNLVFAEPKTKDAISTLSFLSKIKGFENIQTKKNNSAYIAVGVKDIALEKSFSNLNNVLVDELRNINPVDLINYKYLVITHPDESINFISKKLGAPKGDISVPKSKIAKEEKEVVSEEKPKKSSVKKSPAKKVAAKK